VMREMDKRAVTLKRILFRVTASSSSLSHGCATQK
jgi:hypothetical protein